MCDERSYLPLPTSDGDGTDDISRSSRDLPPAHYTLEIDSFSNLLEMLKETGRKSYESQAFEAGGYKWKLSLYPNGDEERNGKGYISLYLVIAETDALPLGWEVYANFKLFIYDQIHDKFLKIQDAKKRARHFNRMKTEWGFAQLVSQSDFHDTSNGYLLLNKCAFGAEIYVSRLGKGERLTPMNNFSPSYTWKISRFSSFKKKIHYSEIFILGGLKWKLMLYPKGNSTGAGKYLSLYLCLEESKATQKVYADYKLTILNLQNLKDCSYTEKIWFTATDEIGGWHKFISRSEIKDKSKGFLVGDTLIVEVQIMNLYGLQKFS